MNRLAVVTVLAAASLAVAGPALAKDKPATGHTPIVVCHNLTHNPHIIVVDDDSTKLHAHLAHRTQSQLMDLVEGVDGTAAQIRALCVRPSPTTSTPSPTTTGSTPSTSTTHSTVTSAPVPTDSPSQTSSTTTTRTTSAPPTSSPAVPTKTANPPTGSTQPSVSTDASPRRSGPSSTVAPPELARTGFEAALVVLAAGLLGLGVVFTRLARKGARREH